MNGLIRHRTTVACVGCAMVIAACGAAGSTPTGTSGNGPNNTPELLSFVKCARSHGVPNLPDPGASPSDSGAGSEPVVSFMGITFPPGVTPQSPAFQTVMQSCKHLLPNRGTPPPISASERRKVLAAAQCMRTHGVPNFPDPVFPSHGGIGIREGGAGINPQSPAFQKAAKACGNFP